MNKPAQAKPKRVATAMKFFSLFSDLVNFKNVTMLAGLAVLAVTGLFGGWEEVTADHDLIATYSVTDPISAAPFEFTLKEAFWSDDISPITGNFDESVYFVALINAAQTTNKAIRLTAVKEAIGAQVPDTPIASQPGLWSNSNTDDGSMGPPTIYRQVDLQNLRTLAPNMPQDFYFVWTLPPGTAKSPQVELHYHSQTWRKSSLEPAYDWFDTTLVGTQLLELPIKEGASDGN